MRKIGDARPYNTGDWLPGGDELTPTMKLKRRPIAHKYAAEIQAMYS